MRFSFFKNRPEYALIHDDDTKDFTIEILQAILCSRKMSVTAFTQLLRSH